MRDSGDTRSVRWGRLLLATLLPPIPVSLLVAAGMISFGSPDSASAASILLFAFFGLVVAYPAMILLALPAHITLRAFGRCGLIDYAVLGLVGGFVTVRIVSALGGGPLLWATPAALCAGVGCATVFWLIRRPDRDAANPPTSAP